MWLLKPVLLPPVVTGGRAFLEPVQGAGPAEIAVEDSRKNVLLEMILDEE
jgi:hypothetical protein